MPPVVAITLDSDSGAFRARVFPDTGRIALAGPDLAGAHLANVVTLEPPKIRFAGQTVSLGRVIGSPRKPAEVGRLPRSRPGPCSAKAIARLTFPADGMMRHEAIDWVGPTLRATSIAAVSDPSRSFFGLGERLGDHVSIPKRIQFPVSRAEIVDGDHNDS